MHNPSLRQIPRRQPAEVLPSREDPSILVWLEKTGRLKPREEEEIKLEEEVEAEELSDLMGSSERDTDDELPLEDE